MAANQQGNYSNGGIDLKQLYQKVFGTVGLPFLDLGVLSDNTAQSKADDYSSGGVLELATQDDFSDGGNFVQNTGAEYDSVKVYKSAGDSKRLGTYYFMPTSLNGNKLPNEPLVSIQVQKRIVRTVVAGSTRRGTVKELVATEDYKISIKGVVINETNPEAYPENEVSALRRLVELRTAVPISNKMCRLMGVNRVIITGLTLNADIEFQGLQSYEMNCESDNDFEFEIVK